MEYRKDQNNCWHFCSKCSNWPTSNYKRRKRQPTTGELCNECKSRRRRGNCRVTMKDKKSKIQKLVTNLEEKLDDLNGEHGTTDRLCIFCGSNEFNAEVGIVHDKDCIILILRNLQDVINETRYFL